MTKFQGMVLVAGGRSATLMNRKAGLSHAGFRVETALDETDALAKARRLHPNVALLEGAEVGFDSFRLSSMLRADPHTSELPIMLLDSEVEAGPELIDDVIMRPAADAIVIARMQELVRLATIQDEARCRVHTAKQFGLHAAARQPLTARQSRLLVVGGTPDLAEAIGASGHGYAITHEANPYLAAAHLDGGAIDAIVVPLDILATIEHQLYFCRHIRKNSRYFNLPILLLATPETFVSGAEPYRSGATVALPLPLNAAAAAAIERLVARQRRRRELRTTIAATLAESTRDSLVGIYSTEFLRAHLRNQIEERAGSPRPLSLLVVEIANAPALGVQFGQNIALHVLQQAADFLCGLVRIEDLCARLSPSRIAVALPDGDESAARQVSERVSAVLEHTEFGLGTEAVQAAGLWIETGVASLATADRADDLINRALEAVA
ncbi:MAG: diguanylate cyclase [Alphaproteobacteria bacterium]|nr:diguanylate cyclase [Alphaproteobacteria bacterium]